MADLLQVRVPSPHKLRSFQSRSSDPAVHLSWAPKTLGEPTFDSPLDTCFQFEDEYQKQYLDIVDHEAGGSLPKDIAAGRPVMVELAGMLLLSF